MAKLAKLPKFNSPKFKYYLKISAITCAFIFAISIIVFSLMIFGVIDVTKNIINAGNVNLNLASVIYSTDDTGKVSDFETVRAEENRVWVDLANIPINLQHGIVAIEDERFYKHAGFDLKSTTKAAFDHILRRPGGRGASTITQQLVKNITGNDKVKISRKAMEIVQAIALERKLSKDEILELYLNTIYLSQGCSGVATASQVYFGKTVDQLTLAECALIAGITQYPSKYDPYLNMDASTQKRNLVLSEMLEQGYIDQVTYDAAIAEPVKLAKTAASASKQSYFADQVIDDVIADLRAKKNMSEDDAIKLIYTGGLKIYSTVDPEVQRAMTNVFTDPASFPVNSKKTDQGFESAMVVLDSHTGAVKGMIGGRGEKKADRLLNRATQSYRQPGSAIKPIAVYGVAVELGLIKPNSVFEDKQVTFGTWTPKNSYAGFKGEMTARHALEQSVNTVAAQIVSQVGVDASYNFLKNKLNISTLDPLDKNIASMALGGLTNGVRPIEMAAAYATFANNGVYTAPYTYTKVVDNKGKTILENKPKTNVAMKEMTAKTMNSMLRSVVTAGIAGSANFRGDIDICGKTGTTDDDFDRWFVGYTPYYAGAVWTGYDQPKSMGGMFNNNPSLIVWRKVMAEIHKGKSGKRFDTSGVIMGPEPTPTIDPEATPDPSIEPTPTSTSTPNPGHTPTPTPTSDVVVVGPPDNYNGGVVVL